MAATADELRRAGTSTSTAAEIAVLRLHADVRVRVLCANHPNLPNEALADLARDPERVVRLALARRSALPTDVVALLLATDDARVQAMLLRKGAVPPALLIEVIEAGTWSVPLLNEVRRQVRAGAGFASFLMRRPRWRHIASFGSFGWRGVGEARSLEQHADSALSLMAANATLTAPARLRLVRRKSRSVQENLARRVEHGDRHRALLMAIGRSWFAAALLEKHPADRQLRAIAAVRGGHILRRARAATSSNQRLLWRLSFFRRWDIGAALAANPHVGRRTMERLAHFHLWPASAVLAGREDLPPMLFGRLRWHDQVDLLLAANRATPATVVSRLASKGVDPFVRQLAETHPQRSLPARMAVAENGDSPAWVLRRLANDETLPHTLREQLLTWLALGGGTGDPTFDPITCTGTPGSKDETFEQAYRTVARSRGTGASLWRARMYIGIGPRTLDNDTLAALAMDISPAVRRVAAGYRSKEMLRLLRSDPSPAVSFQAEQTASGGSLQRMKATTKGGLGWLAVFPALWMLAVALPDTKNGSTSRPSPEMIATQISALRMTTPPLGRWSSSQAVPPATEPVCRAGGTTVWWRMDEAGRVRVIVESRDTDLVASAELVGGGGAATVTIAAGEVREFIQGTERISMLFLALGDDGDAKPISITLTSSPSIVVTDTEGDC